MTVGMKHARKGTEKKGRPQAAPGGSVCPVSSAGALSPAPGYVDATMTDDRGTPVPKLTAPGGDHAPLLVPYKRAPWGYVVNRGECLISLGHLDKMHRELGT